MSGRHVSHLVYENIKIVGQPRVVLVCSFMGVCRIRIASAIAILLMFPMYVGLDAPGLAPTKQYDHILLRVSMASQLLCMCVTC